MRSTSGEKTGRREAGETSRNEKQAPTWHPPTDVQAFRRFRRIICRQAHWRWTGILVLFFMLPPGPATAAEGEEVSPSAMQTGSLLLRMKSGYRVATRMNTDIDARVSGIVARVSVRQEFRNDGADWVEGVYVFPLPDEAAVDQLRIHIGDRYIEGEIREKAQAKKAYEAAKAEGKKASLVEQQRANLFTTSVANIAPGETVVIEVEYQETVAYDEGIFSLRFPITLTPRYIPGQPLPDRQGSGWADDTNRVPDASLVTPPVVTRSTDHKLTFGAEIDAGVPLEFLASRYHVVDVDRTDNRYRVDLADTTSPMDHDLELTWKPVPDSAPRAVLFTEEAHGESHALLMMLPPDEFSAPVQRMARESVFVIDTSGSMHGTSLSQAKRALGLALSGLKPGDRFNIVQFNSETSALFPSSVAASGANIDVARRYVAGLEAQGGTEMRPAIDAALSGGSGEALLKQVVFITDGSVGNEEELYSLIEERLGNTRLFTVGIGSAPNSWFMRKAAEAGRGTFTMIGALHEVNEKMGRLFRKLEQPQVTSISVDWPGAGNAESYPETVPDLYAGEPIYVRARLGKGIRPGDVVNVRGTSTLGSWEAALDLSDGDRNNGVAALWARAKIESLMDRQRRGMPEDQVRPVVVETALAHHLVSKYTSLVAIDKTPVRPNGAGLTKEQVPNLLPYGQSQEAIFGFPATATGAGIQMLAGVAFILMALTLLSLSVRGGRSRVVRS
jgi:Ca-activated chloride channel family protein